MKTKELTMNTAAYAEFRKLKKRVKELEAEYDFEKARHDHQTLALSCIMHSRTKNAARLRRRAKQALTLVWPYPLIPIPEELKA